MSLALALLGGAVCVVWLPRLPHPLLVAVLPVLGAIAGGSRWACRGLAFALGAAAVVQSGTEAVERRWPVAAWHDERTIDVTIADFVRADGTTQRFVADWQRAAGDVRRLRLSWYRTGQQPVIGERWRLRVRLRVPRGLVNAGGFDSERYWLATGIDATGYVVASNDNRRIARAARWSLAALRRHLADAIAVSVARPDAAGVLIALATGSRHALTAPVRELTAATGTAHLLAISGLHVGLAAAAGIGVGRLAMLPVLLAVRRPLRAVAAGSALLSAAGYAALAGFALPTRRALVMLAVVLALWALARRTHPWSAYGIALGLVACLWPLSVLTGAFFLSFGIVALLIVASERDRLWRRRVTGWRFVRYQSLLSVSSLAIGAALFAMVPWTGFLANLLLIPLVSLLVLPMLIGGLAFASIDPLPLVTAGHLVGHALDALARLDAGFGNAAPVLSLATLAAVAVAAWLPLPLRFRAALAALFLMIDVAGPGMAGPAKCVRIDVFDAGQGQATLVRTARHAVLIDTGPSWPGGSAARSTLLPLFARLGVRRLDLVIVSHADNDHAGGVAELAARMEVAAWLAGEPLPALGEHAVRACRRGQRWRYGAAAFHVVGPPDVRRDGNDASCVVSIAVGGIRVLLPGDIEAAAERELVATMGDALAADVVLIPHHGSRSSSTPGFIAAVDATHAIAAAGYRNRWRFPAADVVRRWQSAGARVYSTGERGALHLNVCSDSLEVSRGDRREPQRWWRVPEA